MKPECVAAREWLMEADLPEIRDESSAYGPHVRTCAECGAAVRALLLGYDRLDAGLAAITPQPAGAGIRRRWLWLSPLVLAAAAAFLIVVVRPQRETLPKTSPVLLRLILPVQPAVIPPAGQQAVIIKKGPITVVWLTPTDRRVR